MGRGQVVQSEYTAIENSVSEITRDLNQYVSDTVPAKMQNV